MLAPHTIKGDRALGAGDTDRLGFRDVARRLTTSLIDRASEDGLVIGLEGEWGSGKSSLLYLIEEELLALPQQQRPTIVNFRPWLIGDRDALITSLFNALTLKLNAMAKGEGNPGPETIAKAKKAADALREFALGVSKVGSIVKVVGEASGFKPLEWIGGFTSAAGEFLHKGRSRSLTELKEKLVKSLRELNHRFVVTVDDVDRLEPAEVIEVLRLVRSVVDLPNVLYLLCFDGEILSHSIEQAAQVKSGRAYLEKIVQLTVFVPKPEPFQLRQWFLEELKEFASVETEDQLLRLNHVIDYEGGRQLRTPRSVVRTLDAMRFYWPPLRDAGGDLSDLVWLQLIKDGNAPLYRWIETYCATAAWVALGIARVEEAEIDHEAKEMMQAVPDGHFSDRTYRYYFSEQLPGVAVDYTQGSNGFKLFQQISDRERAALLREKRLASPDHYRLYFALNLPAHALSQNNTIRVWSAAKESVAAVSQAMLDLYGETVSSPLSKLDILLDRLEHHVPEVLSTDQARTVLLGLADILDVAYLRRPFEAFWPGTIWDRSENLVRPILKYIGEDQRAAILKTMFSQGQALGWLSSLFRREIFRHGRSGDESRHSDEWLVSNGELDMITTLIQDRLRALPPEDLLATPTAASVLYGWYQSGDKTGPRDKLASVIISDDGLVRALETLTSAVHSSHRGRYKVLRAEPLSWLMDYESARARITALVDDDRLGTRAKHLVAAFEDGEDGL